MSDSSSTLSKRPNIFYPAQIKNRDPRKSKDTLELQEKIRKLDKKLIVFLQKRGYGLDLSHLKEFSEFRNSEIRGDHLQLPEYLGDISLDESNDRRFERPSYLDIFIDLPEYQRNLNNLCSNCGVSELTSSMDKNWMGLHIQECGLCEMKKCNMCFFPRNMDFGMVPLQLAARPIIRKLFGILSIGIDCGICAKEIEEKTICSECFKIVLESNTGNEDLCQIHSKNQDITLKSCCVFELPSLLE